MSGPAAPRVGRARRVSVDVALAVLLPLVGAGLVAVVRPPGAVVGRDAAPTATALAAATVVCPSASGEGTDRLVAASLADAGATGELEIGAGAEPASVTVGPHRATVLSAGPDAAVITARDALAAGLLAARSGDQPLAATDCPPPVADQWFTGLGSGGTHRSLVELVNPNPGEAVADISLWAPSGPVDAPGLRGIAVPGQSTRRLDLASLIPKRGGLTARVTTTRGRLGVSVLDGIDDLAARSRTVDWLPAQSQPQDVDLMLGVVAGATDQTLVLGNANDDEVRVGLRVVTRRAVFTPAGLRPVVVGPTSTTEVSLSAVLASVGSQVKPGNQGNQVRPGKPGKQPGRGRPGAAGRADEVIGLEVTAPEPVTATLRQLVDGDLSELVPTSSFAETTGAVVPPFASAPHRTKQPTTPGGVARLLLGGADAVGAATVTAYDAEGRLALRRRVELQPDIAASVTLPAGTALVAVTPERTGVHGSVVVTGPGGVAVVGLRPLPRLQDVPVVRPGLP